MTPDNPYGPFDDDFCTTISCPYCSEPDFDATGLKSHLLSGDCEEWNATETLTRLFSSAQETSPALERAKGMQCQCAECQSERMEPDGPTANREVTP